MPDTLTPDTARDTIQREIAEQNTSLHRPIWPQSEADTSRTLPILDASIQSEIDAACDAAGWKPERVGEDEAQVWERLAQLISLVGIVSNSSDQNAAPLIWSRVRTLMSGAGYAAHDPIARTLTDLYPVCDLTPGESLQDWTKALTNARMLCGWPTSLGLLPWRALTNAIPLHGDHDTPDHWHRAVALLHILKHVRMRPDGNLAIIYRGTASFIKPEAASNVPGLWTKQLTAILRSLGCVVGTPRGTAHPLTQAVKHMLCKVTTANLLPQAPLPDLPMQVLAGPWSMLVPDPVNADGFYQTGCRCSGVWLAQGGKVSAYAGTAHDAIAYAWNLHNPGAYKEAREALESSMPTTYPTTDPADAFLVAFPNMELNWAKDKDAAKVLLALPWYASVMRESHGAFSKEYPLVIFLPDAPTPEGSTNQGKSSAALVYARTLVSSAPSIGAPDTGSAPDARAIADAIATHGTVALDEWSPPISKGHVLSHANLQMLCTGSTVASGRVMENSGALRLRHSLIASSKAVDFPPDMINRSLFWPMRAFTDAELSRPDVKQACASGKMSVALRLAALSIVETKDVHGAYARASRAAGQLRFDDHMALARALYEVRTGRKDTGEIDACLREMRARYAAHTQEADSSGVLAGLESGTLTKVRLSGLFGGMASEVMVLIEADLRGLQNQKVAGIGPWNTTAQMLETLRVRRGFPTLQAMLPSITGSRGRVSDRVIVQSLNSDIRQVVPEGQSVAVPDSAYRIERGPDAHGYLRLRLVAPSSTPVPSCQVSAPSTEAPL